MNITLHWWAWFLVPAAILVSGFAWAGVSARNDTGLSAGIESAFIALGAVTLSVALAVGILIGHFS
jgi:hypothetical protein